MKTLLRILSVSASIVIGAACGVASADHTFTFIRDTYIDNAMDALASTGYLTWAMDSDDDEDDSGLQSDSATASAGLDDEYFHSCAHVDVGTTSYGTDTMLLSGCLKFRNYVRAEVGVMSGSGGSASVGAGPDGYAVYSGLISSGDGGTDCVVRATISVSWLFCTNNAYTSPDRSFDCEIFHGSEHIAHLNIYNGSATFFYPGDSGGDSYDEFVDTASYGFSFDATTGDEITVHFNSYTDGVAVPLNYTNFANDVVDLAVEFVVTET